MIRNLYISILLFISPNFGVIGQSVGHDLNYLKELKTAKIDYPTFFYNDSKGFVWISSTTALYRYDGHNIKRYSGKFPANCVLEPELDKSYLGTNLQSHFFEDNIDQIWFSSYIGINAYRHKTDDFRKFQIKDNNGDCIESDYRLIHLDNQGQLFFRAGEYLVRLNVETHEYKIIDKIAGVRFAVSTYPSGAIHRIVSCPWMFSNGIEVFEFSNEGALKEKEIILEEVGGLAIEVRYAVRAPNDAFYLFTNKGLVKYDPLADTGKNIIPGYSFITGDYLDDDKLFLAMNPYCTKLLNTSNDSLIAVEKKNPITELKIAGIYKDDHDNVWLGNDNHKPIFYGWKNQNKFINLFDKFSIENERTSSIVQDETGKVWVSSLDGDIFLFDSDFSKKYSFLEGEKKHSTNLQQLTTYGDQEIWALGFSNLKLYGPDYQNRAEYNFGDKQVFSIAHLSDYTKLIWSNSGMLRLNIREGNSNYEVKKEDESRDFSSIRLFQTAPAEFYLPQNNALLKYRYDRSTDDIHLIDSIAINNTVWAVNQVSNSLIYIGTAGGLYISKNGNVEKYNFNLPDLESVAIFGILIGDDGLLYLGTDKGLIRVNMERGEEHIFHEEDGLPSNSFSLYAHTKLSDGRLCFSTDKGPVVFDPKELKANPYKSQIIIHGISDTRGRSYTRLNPNLVTNYTLKHHQNNLVINAIASGFYLNELNTIKYKLNGRDRDWQYTKNGKSIDYFDLEPNEYELEILGINANGVFGPKRKISFEIQKPWWKSWWFILLASAFLIFIFWRIFRSYYQRKLRKQQVIIDRQKALQDERSRIASELHDDLGSNLSTIRFMSSLVNKQMGESKLKDKLDQIFSTAGDLMEKMEDIIWATNPENDSLENLFIHLREYSSQFLETHELLYDFDLPTEVLEMVVGGEKRRNILLVAKEILNNIVKHAQAKKVLIHAHLKGTVLHLQIQDDGIGLREEEVSPKRNGLINIKKRINATGGDVNFDQVRPHGTLVKLIIPLNNI